ncbi:MAG: 30S ribosomal protein S2 [Flavobacteriales bacterium]|nr:30S ribosomal protein S2 [Flavobacteriales bacterium]
MAQPTVKEMLDAGVHYGHLRSKWNPAMSPYIFHMEGKGAKHIIDLNKTSAKLEEACNAVKSMARAGKKVLFVATKKQAQGIIAREAARVNMPYVTERWPGGMLTNFATIRKAIKKMATIDKMDADGTSATMSKRERLMISRQRVKLERDFGSIADLTRLPSAIFIVDVIKEHIAVKEAKRLKIPTFAIVDTNANPKDVDFAIPGNDDASKAIEVIVKAMADAVAEGLAERKAGKNKEEDEAKSKEAATENKVEAAAEETKEVVAEVETKAEATSEEEKKA